MSRFRGNLSVLAAILAMAAVQFYSPNATADGGGAGPRFYGTYGPDTDDEDKAEAEDLPTGFTFTSAFSLESKFSFGLAQPFEFTAAQEETATPIKLKGLYAEYSGDYSLNLRFNYRFPTFAETEEPAKTEAPEPMYQLWVGDKVMDGLTIGTEMFHDLETQSPEELNSRFSITPETARAWAEMGRAWKEWGEQARAKKALREWLGDDAVDELQEDFSIFTDSVEAGDVSAWNENHYYCGGTCVAAWY